MGAAQQQTFMSLLNNPLKFRLFLLNKLPAAFFAGLRVKEINEDSCIVTVPYKWFNKNPFRSTYFASLAMAAELSTGALAMSKVYGRKPAVSMLVTKLEAGFFKKAVGITTFICKDGNLFDKAIEAAIATGEGHEVKVLSSGVKHTGEKVAEFFITWSFKVKNTK